MPERTLDAETLGRIRLFEDRTGARVKDCLEAEGKLVYLVEPGEIRKAVGPGGAVVEAVKEAFKREVQVVEYSDEEAVLVRNIFFAFGPRSVEIVAKGNGRHATVTVDPAWKARAIGKAGKNLRIARAILLRHTGIDSISVA